MPKNPDHPIPKHALGDATPRGPLYVVRLRNPYLLARIDPDPADPGTVRLACWPPDYATSTTPGKLSRVLAGLVEHYANATRRPYPDWTAAPAPPGTQPPPGLLLDNARAAWTGILQPAGPRLWEVTDDPVPPHPVHIKWLPHFPGPPPSFPDDTRATSSFYQAYPTSTPHDTP